MCYNMYVQFYIMTFEKEGVAESDAILMQERCRKDAM